MTIGPNIPNVRPNVPTGGDKYDAGRFAHAYQETDELKPLDMNIEADRNKFAKASGAEGVVKNLPLEYLAVFYQAHLNQSSQDLSEHGAKNAKSLADKLDPSTRSEIVFKLTPPASVLTGSEEYMGIAKKLSQAKESIEKISGKDYEKERFGGLSKTVRDYYERQGLVETIRRLDLNFEHKRFTEALEKYNSSKFIAETVGQITGLRKKIEEDQKKLASMDKKSPDYEKVYTGVKKTEGVIHQIDTMLENVMNIASQTILAEEEKKKKDDDEDKK